MTFVTLGDSSLKFLKICPMTSQACGASWDVCECFDLPSKGKESREGKLRKKGLKEAQLKCNL
jgi:hypothetical protein